MKALLYNKKLEFTSEHPAPTISYPTEVLIDVHYTGICGTDLGEVNSGANFFASAASPEGNHLTGKKLPQVMGHEISGIVLELGPQVEGINIGDHVVVEPVVCCADALRFGREIQPCEACQRGMTNICHNLGLAGLGAQDGGLAEQVVVDARHVIVVPKKIPLDVVSLVQPLAVSWHAVELARLNKDCSVLVIGGGMVGLAAIISAFAMGASTVVCSEIAKIRRDSAQGLGATGFDPSKHSLEELVSLSPDGNGFDFSFDCTGLAVTLDTAIKALKARGTCVNVAIWPANKPVEFYPMAVTAQEKCYMGSMCYTRQDFEHVIEAMADHRISVRDCKKLITSVVPLEMGIEGFEHLSDHKDTEVKVLITPNNHNEVDSHINLVPESISRSMTMSRTASD